MSRRKRKGLRSLRSVFVLFVTILLIIVAFLLFVKIYLTFSPICPEYNKMVKVALSDKNGYVYFERASDIAKKISCGFFGTMRWYYYTQKEEGGFENKENIHYWMGFSEGRFLIFYKLLVMNRAISGEFDSYSKDNGLLFSSLEEVIALRKESLDKNPYIFRFKGDNLKDCIPPENDWKSDFLNNSKEVIHNLKIAKEKDYFIFYNKDSTTYETWVDPYNCILLNILVNSLINLEERNYNEVLDWLETSGQVLLHLDFDYIMFRYLKDVIETIASYPSLPDSFYNDLICYLLTIKDEISSREFSEILQKELFYLEDYFKRSRDFQDEDEYRLNHSFFEYAKETSKNLFYHNLAYIMLSRCLEKYRPVLESASWTDVENAVFYSKGKLCKAVKDIENVCSNNKKRIHYFPLTELCSDMLIVNNTILSYTYKSILIVLLEQYHAQCGIYPDSIEKVIDNYFSEEEIDWMNEHIELGLSPEYYEIRHYSIPKQVMKLDKSKRQR